MPIVEVQEKISNTSVADVWSIVCNVTKYPEFMDHVLAVDEISDNGSERSYDWEVLFNGNLLTWREVNQLNEDSLEMTYQQVEGDLAALSGETKVRGEGAFVIIDYHIEFDLGIPSLSALLNPLGEKEILKSYQDMGISIRKCLSQTL